MTIRFLKILILILVLTSVSCKKDDLLRTNPYDGNGTTSTLPGISTGYFYASCNTVTYHGEVSSGGALPVEERGVCYNYSGNPSISFFRINSGSGTGSYECIIPNLLSGYTYYLRGYAVNARGISYGEELSVSIN